MLVKLSEFREMVGAETNEAALLTMVKSMNEGSFLYEEAFDFKETQDDGTLSNERHFAISPGPRMVAIMEKLGIPTANLGTGSDLISAVALIKKATDSIDGLAACIVGYPEARSKGILVAILCLWHYLQHEDELGDWLAEFIGIKET